MPNLGQEFEELLEAVPLVRAGARGTRMVMGYRQRQAQEQLKRQRAVGLLALLARRKAQQKAKRAIILGGLYRRGTVGAGTAAGIQPGYYPDPASPTGLSVLPPGQFWDPNIAQLRPIPPGQYLDPVTGMPVPVPPGYYLDPTTSQLMQVPAGYMWDPSQQKLVPQPGYELYPEEEYYGYDYGYDYPPAYGYGYPPTGAPPDQFYASEFMQDQMMFPGAEEPIFVYDMPSAWIERLPSQWGTAEGGEWPRYEDGQELLQYLLSTQGRPGEDLELPEAPEYSLGIEPDLAGGGIGDYADVVALSQARRMRGSLMPGEREVAWLPPVVHAEPDIVDPNITEEEIPLLAVGEEGMLDHIWNRPLGIEEGAETFISDPTGELRGRYMGANLLYYLASGEEPPPSAIVEATSANVPARIMRELGLAGLSQAQQATTAQRIQDALRLYAGNVISWADAIGRIRAAAEGVELPGVAPTLPPTEPTDKKTWYIVAGVAGIGALMLFLGRRARRTAAPSPRRRKTAGRKVVRRRKR